MKRLLVAVMGLLLLSMQAYAQRTISGTVTDEKGSPVPNVSVTVKGTRTGTVTMENGTYSLVVPAGGNTLVFSNLGSITQEAAIGTGSSVNVTLLAAANDLNEVVVVGYGSVKKVNFTGSANQIAAKDFQNRPLSNPLAALQGAAPGVQTTAPGGAPGSSPGIVIRGFASYTLTNGPLYVVDGAVYDAGFSNLNPDDIESMTVLKDASTTALYGSRGANGVVLINTKKGKKGRQSLSFKAQLGNSNPAIPNYSTVNAFEYFPLAWESYRNGLVYGPTGAPRDSASMIASGLLPRYTTGANAGRQIFRNGNFQDIYQVLGGYNPFNVGNTAIVNVDGTINPDAMLIYGDDLDWLDQGTRTGKRNEYGLNYNSGTDRSDFAASFNYLDEEGWGLNSDMKRFSARVSANLLATKWLKTGFNLAGNRSSFNYAATGGIVNPFYFARYIAPIYPVYLHQAGTGEYILDALGQRQFDFGNESGYARPYNSGRHTIAEHLWNRDKAVRDVVSARAYADIIVTPWLKFTTNISTDITSIEEESYNNPRVGDGYPSGRFSRGSEKVTSYTFNQVMNVNKAYKDHNFDFVAGHENYDYYRITQSGMRIGQAFDGLYVYNNFGTINSLASGIQENTIESYFSRLNYDYDGKYLLTGSLRRDGNSKFPSALRWENFWAVGLGWRVDQEAFFRVPFVNLLKIRGSYGYTGNASGDNLGFYPYQAGYSIGFDDDTRPGTALTSLGSPNLTWETQKPLEFGVEFGLFKGRLAGEVTWFQRKSSGLLFSVPQPLQNGGTTSGGYSIRQNIGSMLNQGIEVQLTGNVVRTKDFNWNVTVNATHYKNELTAMPPTTPTLTSSPFRREVGYSLYEFYTRTYYGVDPADGQALYLGVNAYNAATDRIINSGNKSDTVTIDHNNARQSFVGKSAIPDLYGSINNQFSYKGIELSFVLTYQLGGSVYDGVYGSLMSTATAGGTYHTDIQGRWQNPGDVTNVPRLDNIRTAQFGAASTRWLTNASYLSINNISLAYNLPKSVLSRIGSAGARVFVSGENLHFFTARKGMNVNGSFSGETSDSYNTARMLNAGISLTF